VPPVSKRVEFSVFFPELQRIDRRAADADLEVQVGTRGTSGRSHRRDDLSPVYLPPLLGKQPFAVRVQGEAFLVVLNDHRVSVSSPRARKNDRARIRGAYSSPLRNVDIDAYMIIGISRYRVRSVSETARHPTLHEQGPKISMPGYPLRNRDLHRFRPVFRLLRRCGREEKHRDAGNTKTDRLPERSAPRRNCNRSS